MRELKQLLENNRAWAARMSQGDPDFFPRLSRQQAPEYLWIGCSDSRVPANEIVGLLPGELFVHRNVANVVTHTDLNCLSVIQYAVEVLRVRHIIVCGHYGCGGIESAVRNDKLGLIDNWLRRVQEVRRRHGVLLERIIDESELLDRVCELNVIEQVYNVSRTTIVEDAWWHGQSLSVHGWVYRLEDGLLRDLGIYASRKEEVAESYAVAVKALEKTRTTMDLPKFAQAAPLPQKAPPTRESPRRAITPDSEKKPAERPKPQSPSEPPPLPPLV